MKHKTTFRANLVRSIFLIAIPIIIISCAGSFFVLSNSSQLTAARSQGISLEKIQNQLNFITDNTESLSRDMIFNNEIQTLLTENASGDKYPENSQAAYYINGFIANRDYIDSVVLTGENQTLYSTEKAFTSRSDFSNIKKMWWFPQLEASDGAYQWFFTNTTDPNAVTSDSDAGTVSATTTDSTAGTVSAAHDGSAAHAGSATGTVSAATTDSAAHTIVLTRPILSLKDYTTRLGYVMIYLNDNYVTSILKSIDYGTTSNLWIVDDTGNTLLHYQPDGNYTDLRSAIPASNENTVIRYHGKHYVVGSVSFTENNWRLYIATPYSEVNHSSNIFLFQLLFLTVLILTILCVLTIRISDSMAKPITNLTSVMDAFHGENWEALLQEKKELEKTQRLMKRQEADYENRSDEIGQIYRSYQQLIQRMDTLIQEIYIKNLEKKDAELALLQSQINPHFLYNTLDSINWMALANDQDEISEMVTALSDTFRLSLTKSNSSYVKIDQEIEYVKSYLVLQKFRYADRLTYAFDYPAELSNLSIPRFILQPVVENALKHGIDSIDTGGHIQIVVSIETAKDEPSPIAIQIQVINDGTHIDLAQMEQLLSFDPDNMEVLAFNKKGYGVQNIHRRIRMICGSDYGISYSVTPKTTICLLRLPYQVDD